MAQVDVNQLFELADVLMGQGATSEQAVDMAIQLLTGQAGVPTQNLSDQLPTEGLIGVLPPIDQYMLFKPQEWWGGYEQKPGQVY